MLHHTFPLESTHKGSSGTIINIFVSDSLRFPPAILVNQFSRFNLEKQHCSRTEQDTDTAVAIQSPETVKGIFEFGVLIGQHGQQSFEVRNLFAFDIRESADGIGINNCLIDRFSQTAGISGKCRLIQLNQTNPQIVINLILYRGFTCPALTFSLRPDSGIFLGLPGLFLLLLTAEFRSLLLLAAKFFLPLTGSGNRGFMI